MSSYTVSNLPRLSAARLSQMLLSQTQAGAETGSKIAIIDVRDDDHIGGHIRTSLHVPSHTLDTATPTLVRKLADRDVVVFHCALSQQRGPSAALRYLRERERLLGPGKMASTKENGRGSVGEALKRNAEERIEGQGEKEAEEWEDVTEDNKVKGKEQKVYVLDRGFVGWQEVYGEDERLTEGYRKELWQDGYWG